MNGFENYISSVPNIVRFLRTAANSLVVFFLSLAITVVHIFTGIYKFVQSRFMDVYIIPVQSLLDLLILLLLSCHLLLIE